MFSSLLFLVLYAEQAILSIKHLKENIFSLNDYSAHTLKIATTISNIIRGFTI